MDTVNWTRADRSPSPRKRCWLALLIFAAWIAPYVSFAQQTRANEEQVKAAYLYNMGRFVTWPANNGQTTHAFTICVFGSDPFEQTLRTALAGEALGGRPVVTKRVDGPQDAKTCQILFIGQSQKSHLKDLLAGLGQAPVLTASDMPDFLQQGGMIQFVPKSNNIRFEVSLTNTQNTGIVMSSELLKVASKVK